MNRNLKYLVNNWGGSQSSLADFIGVSPVTLRRWKREDVPTERRDDVKKAAENARNQWEPPVKIEGNRKLPLAERGGLNPFSQFKNELEDDTELDELEPEERKEKNQLKKKLNKLLKLTKSRKGAKITFLVQDGLSGKIYREYLTLKNVKDERDLDSKIAKFANKLYKKYKAKGMSLISITVLLPTLPEPKTKSNGKKPRSKKIRYTKKQLTEFFREQQARRGK